MNETGSVRAGYVPTTFAGCRKVEAHRARRRHLYNTIQEEQQPVEVAAATKIPKSSRNSQTQRYDFSQGRGQATWHCCAKSIEPPRRKCDQDTQVQCRVVSHSSSLGYGSLDLRLTLSTFFKKSGRWDLRARQQNNRASTATRTNGILPTKDHHIISFSTTQA